MVIFGSIAYFAVIGDAAAFDRLPEVLLRPPDILGEVLVWLPRSSAVVTPAIWILVAACACAVVGWKTKPATIVAFTLSLYVLGISTMWGKVDHYHHLVLIALLLATSPSGDALSIDALGKPRRPRSVVYGFPIRMTWLVIGLCYFFPGLAKLNGADIWLTAENMRGMIDMSQWGTGRELLLSDRLLLPAAAGTIIFEMGFVFAVFNRRLRPFALAGGLLFHISVYILMGINFWALWICYVAFFDWGRDDGTTDERAPSPVNISAGAIIAAGMLITGFTFTQNAWPVACYPTFMYDARSKAVVTTEVVAVTDGRSRVVPLVPWVPKNTRQFLIPNLLQYPRLRTRYLREAAPRADRVQLWNVWESIDHANRGQELMRAKQFEVEGRPQPAQRPTK
jgi:hypothetical protein